VNLQIITDPRGRLVWISRVLPGRIHDLNAARNHRVVYTCIRLGIPVLADLGYLGAPAEPSPSPSGDALAQTSLAAKRR
jgi:hypothetical protein